MSNSAEPRKGIKTTEFWFSLCGAIAGIVMAVWSTINPEGSQAMTMVGGILSGIFGGAYTVSRGIVKGKEAIGAAHVQAAGQSKSEG